MRSKRVVPLSLIAAMSVASGALTGVAAMAQSLPPLPPPPNLGSTSRHAGTMSIPINKSTVLNVDRPISKVMIGGQDDPKSAIIDVVNLSDRSIYVLGQHMGTTSLTLIDSMGRVMSIMDVAVGPDVDALTEQLRALVPNEQIDARISNDTIVLTGVANDAGAVDRAVQLARTFAGDKVVNLISMGASQQVMLEVRFAEVSRNSGFAVGVSSSASGNKFGAVVGSGASLVPGADQTVTTSVGGTTVTSTVPGAAILQLSSITGAFGIFRNRFNIGSLTIDGTLNALESKGLSKTLARPTLMALSGEKASFLAGGEFPVPTIQGTGSTTGNGSQPITVQFKPFGVSLSFTPTVLGDKTINLIVEPEVSAIDPTASYSVGNIVIPGLKTRRASTTLELRDGESFAIAGLLSKDFKTTAKQLPFLGSLPILGALFRSSEFQRGDTELLIVVTPHLVAPITEAQVRLPTDTTPDPTAIDTILPGRPDQSKPLPPVPAGKGNADATPQQPAAPQSSAAPASPAAAPAAPEKKEPSYAY